MVVVSAPLTPETTGLIGAAELARMRPTAVLVNVGRGPVVDEKALYTALVDRAIDGAVIDVWYDYPSSGNVGAPSALPFHELANMLMTPHSSGLTRQTFDGRTADVAANINRLAAGQPASECRGGGPMTGNLDKIIAADVLVSSPGRNFVTLKITTADGRDRLGRRHSQRTRTRGRRRTSATMSRRC